MKYMFFYKYVDGTEGFGFYDDYHEAESRMDEFEGLASHYTSQCVEFGIAEIEKSKCINCEEE